MIAALLILLAADVSYGEHPPIRVCDEGAYLTFDVPAPPLPVMPLPPADAYFAAWRVDVLLRDFVHAYTTNRPLPGAGRASETYQEAFEQWKRDGMRRRNQ